MIVVRVINITFFDERRDDHQRNTRAVAEEVQRLDIARVIVTTTIIKSDKNGSAFEHLVRTNNLVHNLGGKALKQRERGRGWMPIVVHIRFDKRDCWQG